MEAIKELLANVVAFILGTLGCLFQLAIWGIAIILALMMGSCILRAIGILG